MILGARKYLDEAKQPGDFFWELAPLWRSAEPGSLPGNNFAARETFLLNQRTVFTKKPGPLLELLCLALRLQTDS